MHPLHLFGFPPLSVCKCLPKLPTCEDAKSHWLHLFGLSRLCIFKWLLTFHGKLSLLSKLCIVCSQNLSCKSRHLSKCCWLIKGRGYRKRRFLMDVLPILQSLSILQIQQILPIPPILPILPILANPANLSDPANHANPFKSCQSWQSCQPFQSMPIFQILSILPILKIPPILKILVDPSNPNNSANYKHIS